MTRAVQTKAFITRHFFILAFPFVLLLALWWPSLGASGGLLRSEHTGKFAVALVFLVQGLTLSRRQILAGALNPRFQVLTQGFIFVGFPLMGMLLMYVLGSPSSDP
jgi:sodium/bile acid cotransporter 7